MVASRIIVFSIMVQLGLPYSRILYILIHHQERQIQFQEYQRVDQRDLCDNCDTEGSAGENVRYFLYLNRIHRLTVKGMPETMFIKGTKLNTEPDKKNQICKDGSIPRKKGIRLGISCLISEQFIFISIRTSFVKSNMRFFSLMVVALHVEFISFGYFFFFYYCTTIKLVFS